MLRVLILLAVLFSESALAAEGPSFDCTRAEGSAEELVCSDALLQALDRRMAEIYRGALAAVRNLDVDAKDAEAELKAMQRGWIKGRNDCWKAGDLRDCVESAYLRRSAELVATWMLEEHFSEAAWQCGNNGSNVVFTMYFETALPAVRVEYGDGVAVMLQSPAASGTLYEGPFGQMFWEKGGKADFMWRGLDAQTCVLVAG